MNIAQMANAGYLAFRMRAEKRQAGLKRLWKVAVSLMVACAVGEGPAHAQAMASPPPPPRIGVQASPSSVGAKGSEARLENDEDPDLRDTVEEGGVFKKQLLLRARNGALAAFDLASHARTLILRDGVLDIDAGRDGVWIIKGDRLNAPPFERVGLTVFHWTKTGLLPVRSFPLLGEVPVAIVAASTGPIVVMNRSIRRWNNASGSWNRTELSGGIDYLDWHNSGGLLQARLSGNERLLFLGSDFGEWGGSLQWIDVASGHVERMQGLKEKGYCWFWYNNGCQERHDGFDKPVTGIVADPQSQACAIVTLGLRHRMEFGTLLRVCGGRRTLIFTRPMGGFLDGTEPFFGIARGRGTSYWVASPYRLYRFSGSHRTPIRMPKPERFGGVWLSQRIPGLVIVASGMRAHNSLSGYTPLLIPTAETE